MNTNKKRDVKLISKHGDETEQQPIDAPIPPLLTSKERARTHRLRKKKYGIYNLKLLGIMKT